MEHGTSKEHETLMEIETFTSDSMMLERQIDITSPCQAWVECVFDMLLGTKDAWVEVEQSELIGLKFDSENDAYEAYRRYSFIKCFGIRHSNLRKTNQGDVIGREFYCFKQGNKAKKGVVGKKYTKLDRRTHCKAMVRRGGSAIVGFEYGDAATAIKKAGKKKFDVTDCNTLINILKQRAASEEDFYYDFELDENNALVSVFFRDKIMRQDYEAYYELLGNDGTYCTNKYDMICAPFVGINNHTRICLFGVGFMLNERTESFEWLYGTFLKSMGGIQPKTIMTDQFKAMSNAIKECFPHLKHRLCVWHLFKN
ncbi:protein FAR1-RELATED SEQUENCE 5-like [Silene latifolia]|uniref:protein FAR1-RELATED SEQUENCE 5-like n=1 Tax=Silene latifolia TaxID=37657 RepID=UPI003D7852B7